MKFNSKYYLALVPAMLLASCADYFDTANYLVEQPESDARLQYLDEYKPIKEYVNRSAHPGFLLGTGVNAQDFIKGEGVYLLTKSNFDMVTTGNAMKYASCVNDKGEMDFGTVRDFVSAAESAGLQVYGHTLVWHSQQNTTWLNSLLADKKIEGGGSGAKVWAPLIADADGSASCPNLIARVKGNEDVAAPIVDDAERGKVYKCDILANPEQAWDCQFFIKSDKVLEAGTNIRLSFMYKSTDSRNIDTQAHGNPGEYHHWACIGTLGATPEWQEKTWEGPVDAAWVGDNGFVSVAFNLSSTADAATFLIDDVVMEVEEDAPAVIQVPLIDAADGSAECANLISRVKGNADVSSPIVSDPERGNVYKCDILASPTDAWDCQFFIKSNQVLKAGDKISLKFMYRADDTRNIETQAHGNPGEYHHWSCIGTLAASPEWKEHKWEGSVDGAWEGDNGFISVAFNLSSAAGASAFYVDDVEFTVERAGNTMPLTPQEKAEILDNELKRWITASMEATSGKVKAWDLVNEPLQDTWGDIPLKTDPSKTDANNFYWQDYLGENYVVIAEKYAREAFAAQEGTNPADLKLFINDYNLEAAYNNNDKCKSLVNWIGKWEAAGAKIDGIGSQMHVTYSLNTETQKKNEDAVVNMLQILANSGKLIRITELDMGIADAAGNTIKTADVTFEQHQAMGDYYKFIIKKYFEIIPVAQQFGICQWAQTDSPAGSGWRADEPIGLWNLNYQRKPQYGKVCEAYEEAQ